MRLSPGPMIHAAIVALALTLLPLVASAQDTGLDDTSVPELPEDPVDADPEGDDTDDWVPGTTAAELAGEAGGSACAAGVIAPIGLSPLLLLLWVARRETESAPGSRRGAGRSQPR